MNKKLNLEIGTKFGKWEIISKETTRKNNLTHWKCKCECGFSDLVPLNNLMNGSSTQCKSCSAKKVGLKKRKGCGDISGEMWAILRLTAMKSGHEFDLRLEEAWDKFKYQEGRCALSNMKINISGYPYSKKKTTAELSLINNYEGYNVNNIMWIHKKIAKMKSKMSLDEFLELIHIINVNNGGKRIN